jgi:hypothetical protein
METARHSPRRLEFPAVSRGHELTRKRLRLACGLAPLDAVLGGGIPRCRITEITGPAGAGRTSVAARFMAAATRRGEVAAWIDYAGAFDPAALSAANADLKRILWVSSNSCNEPPCPRPYVARRHQPLARALKAAELVLAAGGFGLVVIDFGPAAAPLTQGAALRLARAAERGNAAVIVVASRRICGTFAALGISLNRLRTSFGHLNPDSPAIFDGLVFEAWVARNKLGASGGRAMIHAAIDIVRPGFAVSENTSRHAPAAPRIVSISQ